MRAHVRVLAPASPALVARLEGVGVTCTAGDLTGALSVPDRDTHVLVVGTSADEHRVRREAGLLEAATGRPVAWRALPGGPSAAGHAVLAACRETSHPAGLLDVLDRLVGGAFCGAWMPTVSRLEDPAPRLGQHLRSWLPGGSGYLAVHLPRPVVLPADGGTPQGWSEPGRRGPLLVCGSRVPDAAVRLAAALAGSDLVEQVPAADAVRRYGTESAVELVALPAGVHDEPEPDATPCPVCELPLRGSTCPYCRVAVHSHVEGVPT